MFNLTQPKPETLRQRIDQAMYRLADHVRPMSDGKVVIAVVVGYVLAVMIGWPP